MMGRPRALGFLLSLVLALGLFVGLATNARADEPTATYSFNRCYDVQRWPPWPKTGQEVTMNMPTFPLIGYTGSDDEPVANRFTYNEGDWKLSYYTQYKDMSTSEVNTPLSTSARNYGGVYKVLSMDNIPVFELTVDDTHVAYGLLWAVTEKDSEPLVFFVGDTWPGGGGYVLSNSEIKHEDKTTMTEDLAQVKQSIVGADIAVSGGEHATKSGGATSQTGLTGAIEQLNYTAETGFHFAQFDDVTENGITVHWVSRSEVTVSGTPTRDTSVTVPDAQADPAKKPTPEATFTATDYDKGTLGNMKEGQQYRIDGGEWIDVPSDAAIDLTGLSPCTIEVIERGDGVTTVDSDIETIVVTRAAAPTGPAATDCTTLANDDGALVGVTGDMQYKASDADAWNSGDGSVVTGLGSGTYLVRTKPTGTVLASENLPLTVRSFLSHVVKFRVVNGTWADGTRDEKVVTLTGHEGGVLEPTADLMPMTSTMLWLTADQIPAVGGNPDAGFVAGSWDVTPTTTLPIGADTTFTYTYAPDDPVTPTQATVTFDANGGTGTMDALPVTVGETVKLTANTFTRDGYTFAGWNTKADGTGTAYADLAEVEVTEDLTLYAQWTKAAPQGAPKAAATSTSKGTPKTGDADLGGMCALLAAVAGAALVASRGASGRARG